jgi:hypothetical protein
MCIRMYHRVTINDIVLPKSIMWDTSWCAVGYSMAIVFNTPIIFNDEEVFPFESLSCIVDRKGVRHRIADPPEK